MVTALQVTIRLSSNKVNVLIQDIIHGIMTFLDLAALSTLTGAVWCCIWMARPANGNSAYPEIFLIRFRRMLFVCLSALVIISIYGLVQRSIEMSGVGVTAIFPVIPTVLFKTHYGNMWFVRIAGLFAAWSMWLVSRKYIGSRFFEVLLFCAVSAIAFSRSASGHPADFGDLSSQQLADFLHLLAVSSWGGALMAIAIIFPASLVEKDGMHQRFLTGIADRFYVLFGPVLSVLVLTGLYNAWFEVGSFMALATTPYGKLLSAKLLLFLFLVFRNIVPPDHNRDEGRFAIKFLHRTRFEAIVIVVVLLFISMVIHKIPAKHQLHLEHLGTQSEVRLPEPVVTLETNPVKITAGTNVAMTVSIKGPDGSPFKGLAVSHERILHAVIIGKDLESFDHIHTEDIGPVTSDMMKKASFPLLFTFPKTGEYLVGIDFSTEEEFYSRTFSLNVSNAPGMGGPKFDFSTKKDFGEYNVALSTFPENIRAGGETELKYVIEKNGKPVTDLEPYLNASMHLAVVNSDLKIFIHAHGSTPGETHNHHDHVHATPPPERFGPEITSEVVFPEKATYKIFSQVKHQGKVLLFDFMVDVK